MLSRNVHTTVELVVQIFRIRRQSNVKYITSFKETAINFFEERLENNLYFQETLSNMLKNVINNNVVIASTYAKYDIMPSTDLEKIKKKEAVNELINYIYKQPIYVLIHTISKTDTQCCDLLDVMSYYDIFKLLLFFTKAIPARISRMNFYNKVTDLLRKEISNEVFNKEEIILCIYFIGLAKEHAANDIRMALKYLEFDKLSLYETCIVAETAYKCKVKLLRKQIEEIEELIESKAGILVANTSLLVPLCKVLRHAGVTKNFFPNNLNKEIINKSNQYQMIPAIHILTFYKEMHIAEPMVLQRLVTDIMARISLANQTFENKQGLYTSQIYTPKYIDGFLWNICMLNHKLTDEQLLEVRTFLDSMQFALFLKPQQLLRVLLSLWILGYRAESMIQECIKRNIFLDVRNEKFWKLRTLSQLLLHVIRIESPNIELNPNLFPDIHVTLDIPKSVKIVSEIVSGFTEKMKLQNVIINSPIEGIYIAGVSFDHPSLGSCHIDLLNNITCLQSQKIPYGLMNLKLRLLSQLGYRSILIDEDDVKDTIAVVEYIEKRLYEVMYAK